MIKSIFKGSIQLGLLSIPIKLYLAQKSQSIEFNSLCPKCSNKINEKVVCRNCNIELNRKELLKGYYVSKSEGFVKFTQEEINSIKIKSNKIIDIEFITDSNNIDAIHIDKSYFVLPNYEIGNTKAYFLLNEILSLTNKVGIGRITLRNRENLCIIRAYKKGFVLSILYYPNEIVDFDELFNDKSITIQELTEKELELSKKLIENLTIDNVDFSQFKDRYTEKLKEIIQARLENKSIDFVEKVIEEKEKEQDLIKTLQKSLKKATKKVA